MKAVQVSDYGDPSVLTVAELPDPTPGPGQVAIDVTHAAVGLVDVYLRQGLYKEREGLPRRLYHVTPTGVAALRESRDVLKRMWRGIEHLLNEPS